LVLNDFVFSALTTGEIKIMSDGTPWRPLIHVKDMARAIEWALIRNSDCGNFIALNVGDEKWNYQIKDLANVISKLIPGTQVSINKDAAPDKRSYKVSFKLLENLAPNHKPIITLEEAILELSNGIKECLESGNNLTKNKTIRLATLRDLLSKKLLSSDLVWLNK
jgi:nucleoside-diphosphate-sugar epimerase